MSGVPYSHHEFADVVAGKFPPKVEDLIATINDLWNKLDDVSVELAECRESVRVAVMTAVYTPEGVALVKASYTDTEVTELCDSHEELRAALADAYAAITHVEVVARLEGDRNESATPEE